jgi:hypothetical protein
MNQYADTIRTMMNYGDAAERETAAQHLLEMQKAIPYASDDNKRIINGLLTGRDTAGNQLTYVDAAGATHNQPRFVDYESATPIEDQLANYLITNNTARGHINGSVNAVSQRLNHAARVYDREQANSPTGPHSPITTQPPPNP